jgi:formate hydrogenlyase transcriptional activator
MDSHHSAPPCETLAERYQALLEVAQAISTHRDLDELFRDLAQRLPRVIHVNFVALSLHNPARDTMRLHSIQANVPADLVGGHEGPVEESPAGLVWRTQQPVLVPNIAEEQHWPKVTQRMKEDGVNSFCFVPLTTAVRRLGAMGFSSVKKEAYSEMDLEFLQQVGKQVAVAVDNVLHHQDLTHDHDRLRLLLEVSEAIVSHRDLSALFRDLAQRLPTVAPFNFIGLILHDSTKNVMKVHVLETAAAHHLTTRLDGLELPIEESSSGWVWTHQQPLIIPSLDEETRFSMGMAALKDIGVQSVCLFPLTTAMRRLGAIGFGSLEPRAFGDQNLGLLGQVAKQVAVAVDNVLHFSSTEAAQQSLARERDRLSLVLEINNAVASHLELRALLKAISACLGRVIPHDFASFCLYDPEIHQLRAHALDFPGNQDFVESGDPIPLEGTPEGLAFTTQQTVHVRRLNLTEFPAEIMKRAEAEGLKSGCAVPLLLHGRALGTLSVVSMQEDAFTDDDATLFSRIGAQVALAAENAMAYQEISSLRDKLAKEKLYLEEEIQTAYNFEEIVGDSRALKLVLKEIQTVAATDSTVLILGETGSGKELVARALHNHSNRRERTFVKINCAAIPTGLLESELFGHERGAFTGAIATKIGRFELADRGTIFLDEVGEIPLELQVKLLRVLQEQEFERLGNTKTIRVNVRIIAATNRDLDRMVEEQRFRSDLYYRLKVFPVTVPPLRDRVEDIPLLVRHFAQKFAQRMKKRIETIPSEAMQALQAYDWRGNVRELENFIERAVILTQGQALFVSLAELKRQPGHVVNSGTTTLEQAEREHILKALRESEWIIGGPAGAAAKLGMKRTTLQSKMQKLGISRPS